VSITNRGRDLIEKELTDEQKENDISFEQIGWARLEETLKKRTTLKRNRTLVHREFDTISGYKKRGSGRSPGQIGGLCCSGQLGSR